MRSQSVTEGIHSQRSPGVYGDVYGTSEWKNQSKRRVTMLPPDFRCSPSLRLNDSELYRKHAVAPGGMYNYESMANLPEEPLISDVARRATRVNDDDGFQDFRRKTHFELQAASAIIDVDSAYAPGGPARCKAEGIFRHSMRSRNGRRAYAESVGHPFFATNWDSHLTKKHDLAIALPPGMAEKIKKKAWRSVEKSLKNGKTGFCVQPELVPRHSGCERNMFNIDSSLTRKFGSSFQVEKAKNTARVLPPVPSDGG